MEKPDPIPQNLNNGEKAFEEEDDNGEEDEEEDLEDEIEPEISKPQTGQSRARIDRAKVENLFHRMQTQKVPVRVHDVIIKGNQNTKNSLIEAETALLKEVSSLQELLEASKLVNVKLQALEVFDSVRITLDSGPPELPGTANVIVEVVEAKSPVSGEIGLYTKGKAGSSPLAPDIEGKIKYKNIFGYGDLWDASLALGGDRITEVSAGVYLPRFKGIATPLTAKVFLLTQDWLKFSSFKEQALGLSLGVISTRNHDLSYNLSWRTLTDPSQMASRSVRRQLGHGLLSSLKYTFRIDQRNSPMRPTHGYSFVSTTHIGGLAPDSRSLRFLRQELDFHYAIPLGFLRSALNIGISGGLILPWGPGFLSMQTPIPERFFLGGHLSPICTLEGPVALYGFRARALGPTEPRRQLRSNAPNDNADPGRDYLGGDLAVTAFADLSFDLPSKWCQARGVHGHIFASAGNIDKLAENAYRSFSAKKFVESFRTSVGGGIVIPTNLFRIELNFCYLLKKFEHDSGKTGFRINFSTAT